MEETEFLDLLQVLSDLSTSQMWFIRHGSLLTFSSMSLYNPSMICRSTLLSSLIDTFRVALKDDKVRNRHNDIS